ncbi:YqcI/YcgG family protein [Halomarina ordinaria]|uniref:YqcI/YcgG family protein n=1 Tax=Halomarina ordinaria TaxID=3033939 RepID=A0ABD5U9Y4_9EURY|nr:YqcI/YcgG family protein [Halomarina sp. PSRA2]
MTEPFGLWNQSTIRRRVREGSLPAWVCDHYEAFRAAMLDEDDAFPCYFGVESERTGMALYTACASTTDPAALATLRDTLVEYTRVFENHSERASLVAFFRPPERPLDERAYFERFWGVLQYLHDHDPVPWPADFPADPSDPHWEFCFGGEPIFPTARAPFYEDRRSRYTPHGLEITFQPRAIFAGITGDTAAGRRAREVIRGRLESYDAVCPHADIGDWGETQERTQYLLPEGEGSHERCPIEITTPRS